MSDPKFTSLFEGIRRVDVEGKEYWSARELLPVLGYHKWQRSEDVLQRAMAACQEAGSVIADHFTTSGKMVATGSGAQREIVDYHLSRLGAYLAAQNCDPRGRPQVAAAQVYFAVKTRQKEVSELREAQERRVQLRERVSEVNKALGAAAQDAGVPGKKFGVFQDAGYKGLYDGLGVEEIKHRKRIPAKEDILDRMGREELAANEFRITQTEAKLRRENIQGEQNAIDAHHQIGRGVRKTIEEFGGTMPEELTPEANIKPLIEERKRARQKLPPKSPEQPQLSLFDEQTTLSNTAAESVTQKQQIKE